MRRQCSGNFSQASTARKASPQRGRDRSALRGGPLDRSGDSVARICARGSPTWPGRWRVSGPTGERCGCAVTARTGIPLRRSSNSHPGQSSGRVEGGGPAGAGGGGGASSSSSQNAPPAKTRHRTMAATSATRAATRRLPATRLMEAGGPWFKLGLVSPGEGDSSRDAPRSQSARTAARTSRGEWRRSASTNSASDWTGLGREAAAQRPSERSEGGASAPNPSGGPIESSKRWPSSDTVCSSSAPTPPTTSTDPSAPSRSEEAVTAGAIPTAEPRGVTWAHTCSTTALASSNRGRTRTLAKSISENRTTLPMAPCRTAKFGPARTGRPGERKERIPSETGRLPRQRLPAPGASGSCRAVVLTHWPAASPLGGGPRPSPPGMSAGYRRGSLDGGTSPFRRR